MCTIKTSALTACFFLFVVFGFSQTTSDTASSSITSKSSLQLVLPLLDLPYATYGAKTFENKLSTQNQTSTAQFGRYYTFLSPDQATHISNDIVSAWHWGVSKLQVFKRKRILKFVTQIAIAAVGDVALLSAPYGAGWLHEEGHRAVMVNSYVFSYNPIIFKKRKEDASNASFQSVSYVLDTNLVLMKKNDNANFVRLSTMGGEMQNYAMVKLQQRSFFQIAQGKGNSLNYLHGFYYLLNFINNTSYISLCADSAGNRTATIESMKPEGNKQYLRDFTGLDFAAWIYDLNRPNEAYAARGANPYGNGYDRYVYGDKLTAEEYKWLKKQTRLSLLNLVSPMCLNIAVKPFGAANSLIASYSLRHYPTSFGNQLGLDVFFASQTFCAYFALHLNQNKNKSFPGIEILVNDYRIKKLKALSVTTRAIVDLQPRQQLFTSNKASLVVLGALQGNYNLGKNIRTWCVLEAKNRGWIAGNAFLDKNVSVRLGLSVYLGK